MSQVPAQSLHNNSSYTSHSQASSSGTSSESPFSNYLALKQKIIRTDEIIERYKSRVCENNDLSVQIKECQSQLTAMKGLKAELQKIHQENIRLKNSLSLRENEVASLHEGRVTDELLIDQLQAQVHSLTTWKREHEKIGRMYTGLIDEKHKWKSLCQKLKKELNELKAENRHRRNSSKIPSPVTLVSPPLVLATPSPSPPGNTDQNPSLESTTLPANLEKSTKASVNSECCSEDEGDWEEVADEGACQLVDTPSGDEFQNTSVRETVEPTLVQSEESVSTCEQDYRESSVTCAEVPTESCDFRESSVTCAKVPTESCDSRESSVKAGPHVDTGPCENQIPEPCVTMPQVPAQSSEQESHDQHVTTSINHMPEFPISNANKDSSCNSADSEPEKSRTLSSQLFGASDSELSLSEDSEDETTFTEDLPNPRNPQTQEASTGTADSCSVAEDIEIVVIGEEPVDVGMEDEQDITLITDECPVNDESENHMDVEGDSIIADPIIPESNTVATNSNTIDSLTQDSAPNLKPPDSDLKPAVTQDSGPSSVVHMSSMETQLIVPCVAIESAAADTLSSCDSDSELDNLMIWDPLSVHSPIPGTPVNAGAPSIDSPVSPLSVSPINPPSSVSPLPPSPLESNFLLSPVHSPIPEPHSRLITPITKSPVPNSADSAPPVYFADSAPCGIKAPTPCNVVVMANSEEDTDSVPVKKELVLSDHSLFSPPPLAIDFNSQKKPAAIVKNSSPKRKLRIKSEQVMEQMECGDHRIPSSLPGNVVESPFIGPVMPSNLPGKTVSKPPSKSTKHKIEKKKSRKIRPLPQNNCLSSTSFDDILESFQQTKNPTVRKSRKGQEPPPSKKPKLSPFSHQLGGTCARELPGNQSLLKRDSTKTEDLSEGECEDVMEDTPTGSVVPRIGMASRKRSLETRLGSDSLQPDLPVVDCGYGPPMQAPTELDIDNLFDTAIPLLGATSKMKPKTPPSGPTLSPAQQQLPAALQCHLPLPEWLVSAMASGAKCQNQAGIYNIQRKKKNRKKIVDPLDRQKKQKPADYIMSHIERLVLDQITLPALIAMFSNLSNVSSPRLLVATIVKFLTQHYLPVIDCVVQLQHDKCDQVRTSTSPKPLSPAFSPVLLKPECMLLALAVHLSKMNPKMSTFLQELDTALYQTIVSQAVRFHQLAALIRVFTGVCRIQGSIERVVFMCFDLLRKPLQISEFPALTGVCSVWPLPLARKPGLLTPAGGAIDNRELEKQCLSYTLEVIVMTTIREKAPEFSKSLSAHMHTLCGWVQVSPGAQDHLVSSLLHTLNTSSGVYIDYADPIPSSWRRPRPSILAYHIVHCLRMLSSTQGWVWTNDHLIRNHLWPLLKKWHGNDGVREPAAVCIVRLIGFVSVPGVKEDPHSSSISQLQRVLIALLSKPQSREQFPAIQLAAVDALLEICPAGHPKASDTIAAIRVWLNSLSKTAANYLASELNEKLLSYQIPT